LFVRSLMAVAVAAAFSFGAVGAAQAAVNIGTGETSRDWAGFAYQAGSGQSFDKVGASWTQPAGEGTCSPSTMGIAAFAVGFDGFGNGTSEQAGTALECVPASRAAGAPFVFKYIAFWETDPGGPHFIPPSALAVNAGDQVHVTITFADGTYTFSFENQTTGQSYSTTSTNSGATNSSVELIAEDPTGGQLPLANFGSVQFSHPDLHLVRDDHGDRGHNGEHLGQFAAITMQKADGTVRAEPHFPSFSVSWKHS
jgi:hypothetical protein